MSNLSDFTAAASGGSLKLGYFTTSGAKTLVTHGGKDKLLYLLRGESDGFWMRQDGELLYTRDVLKITADFLVDISIDANTPGSVKSSFSAYYPNSIDLDYSTGNLVSCSPVDDTIKEHVGITSTIGNSFASPGGQPFGLTVDEASGDLVSSESGTDMIYHHSGISSTVSNSFSAPSSDIVGLFVNKKTGNLFSIDRTEKTVREHDGISSTILSSFLCSEVVEPFGISIDYSNGNIVIPSSSDNKVYVYDEASGVLISVLSTSMTKLRDVVVNRNNGEMLACDLDGQLIYTLTGPSQLSYAAIKYIVQEI